MSNTCLSWCVDFVNTHISNTCLSWCVDYVNTHISNTCLSLCVNYVNTHIYNTCLSPCVDFVNTHRSKEMMSLHENDMISFTLNIMRTFVSLLQCDFTYTHHVCLSCIIFLVNFVKAEKYGTGVCFIVRSWGFTCSLKKVKYRSFT